MLYGPPAYHPALPMQYGYASSMGGHSHYGQPDMSWTPTPIPVPMPSTDTTPPVGSPVNHGRSTEGEGRVNTGSCVRNTERLRSDAPPPFLNHLKSRTPDFRDVQEQI